MAGFDSLASFQAAAEQMTTVSSAQAGTAGSGVGPFVGYWFNSSIRPAPGVAPANTPGEAFTSQRTGGLVFPDTAGRKFLVDATIRSAQINDATLVLADRLVGVGGLGFSATGDKTVNSTALTRYTSGDNVQAWLEISTAGTTTAAVISMSSYTDQDGNAGSVGGTITFPIAAMPQGSLVGPMPLAAGDTGVRSVETINVATAASGSGVLSVILLRTLVYIPLSGTNVSDRQWPFPFAHFVRVYDGFTGMWIMRGFNANATAAFTTLSTVEG